MFTALEDRDFISIQSKEQDYLLFGMIKESVFLWCKEQKCCGPYNVAGILQVVILCNLAYGVCCCNLALSTLPCGNRALGTSLDADTVATTIAMNSKSFFISDPGVLCHLSLFMKLCEAG